MPLTKTIKVWAENPYDPIMIGLAITATGLLIIWLIRGGGA